MNNAIPATHWNYKVLDLALLYHKGMTNRYKGHSSFDGSFFIASGAIVKLL